MDGVGAEASDLPVVLFPDGNILRHPTLPELAEKAGLKTHASEPAYDMVVVGAGPSGLAASVYGASEGLNTLLIEEEAPGGQAGQSSRIENYLGFPKGISGADLARRAVSQATRFGVEMLVPASVARIKRKDPFRIVHLTDGSQVTAKVVLVTSGIAYRRLSADGAENLTGAGIYYGTSRTDAMEHKGQEGLCRGRRTLSSPSRPFPHRLHQLRHHPDTARHARRDHVKISNRRHRGLR